MTINGLIEKTNLSRYYITRAVRNAGIEIRRGRNPTVLTQAQSRKIENILRCIKTAKNIK